MMSTLRVFGLFLFLLPLQAPSAELDLTGKVIGTDGKGIPGVQVILKGQRRSTLTDAEGQYKLDATSTRVEGRARVGAAPALKAGRLAFSLVGGSGPVEIRAFDLSGKLLGTLVEGRLEAGRYDLTLPAYPGSAMVFLKAEMAGRRYVLRYLPTAVGDSRQGLSLLRSEATAPGALLLKSASSAEYDTLVVSKDGYTSDYKRINSFKGVHDFFLAQPAEFWGDPATVPKATQVMTYRFLNRTNGKYADKDIHWKLEGLVLGSHTQRIPTQTGTLADRPTLDLPLHHGGRVTFHLGSANGEYSDFIEQTADHLGWHGNTTRVDAYVLPLAMRLICEDRDELLGEKYEVFYLGREKFFQRYQATVPVEFRGLADASAKRMRITAPGKGDTLFGPGRKYQDYFNPYFSQLGISGPKVTTQFAFACQDTYFNESADLCGAVNRHVAHLPKAQWRNPENFYQQAPANFYSKFIHDYSFREKAYGFAYDDAAEMAAYAECLKPKTLLVAVGF
jgi:hypothetical protein